MLGKKVSGTKSRNGPSGAAHFWCLIPISHFRDSFSTMRFSGSAAGDQVPLRLRLPRIWQDSITDFGRWRFFLGNGCRQV